MISPTLVYILIVALLLLVGIVFLYVVVKKARKPPGQKEAKAELVAADDDDQAQAQAAQLSPYAPNVGLRLSFRKAMKRISAYASGKDARYRIPWFLMIGEAQSGKTTLLGNTGLDLLFDGPREKAGGIKQGVNWFFFDQGIVLDVAGDYVLSADGVTSDGKGWSYLNRLLKRYRPERPLDGIILTIPCHDLMATLNMSAEGKRRLEQKAQALYRKLVLAQKALGQSFPVYVLVTRCDEVTGFKSLCHEIPERRDEIFGWSSPYTREIAYRSEWVTEAFQNIYRYLFQLQIEVFAEHNQVSNSDDLFMLPSEMRALRLPLQIYLDQIFKESAYHDAFLLRGIYFCGDSGDGTTGSETPDASLVYDSVEQEIDFILTRPNASTPLAPALTTTAAAVETVGRRPAFLAHLFERKIFQEDLLARPVKRTMLSRNRLVLAAQLLSLAIPLIGIVGILLTYPGLKEREREFYKFLTVEKQDLEAIQTERETGITDAGAQNREARLFEAMSSMGGKGLMSPFIPTSWFSDVNERNGKSISDAYHYVVFESLRRELDCQTEGKLYLPPDSYASCYGTLEPVAEQSKPLNNCGFESDASLSTVHGFIESIGALIQNRERYDRLIQDESGSTDDLNKLLVALHHAPLPNNFDSQNNLFAQALKQTRGAPLQSSDMDVRERAACKVKGMIQERYDNSFTGKGVTYVHLSDISQAETLLSMQEYSWLATRTFDDKQSAFHGQTISTGLSELKRALNDLSRQKFMPKDSETDSQTQTEPEPERQHSARKMVMWDSQLLQQAVALYRDYANFKQNNSYANADTLDRRVKDVALDSLTNKIEALIKRAYRVQTSQQSVGLSATRTSLDAEIANFKRAQSLLSNLLDISETLPRDIGLRGAVTGQTVSLMRAIDAEFNAQDFYARSQYVRSDQFFSVWNLDQPFHAYAIFGASSPEELEVYLADQRNGIAALGSQYAAPVLNFMAAQSIPLPMGQRSIDWNKVLNQLDKYNNSKPGNTVTVLENFIRVDMNKVKVDECNAIIADSGAQYGDYFIQVRNSLRRSFYEHCNELALEKKARDKRLAIEQEQWARQVRESDFYASLKSYNDIETLFNNTLAGKFPFSSVPKTEPFAEADPEAINYFFQQLTKNKEAATAALKECPKYGISPDAALNFLEEMEQARLFFASFLEKKPLYPLFDFNLKFRVNEGNEVGANQIIDWEFGVGKKRFTNRDTETSGSWGYTDPLVLTMRWANNSPTIPSSKASAALSHMKVNEKTVTLVFNNNWSLLLLLLKHKATGTDFGNGVMGVDIEPYTLKFIVPTVPNATMPSNIQQAQPTRLRTSEVVAFMRVSLMAPSKKDPLILPDNFPANAPKLTNRTTAPYQSSGQE